MQISCGIKTKCRKTRAMLRDFTILNSLALKQLRHFYDSRHSFAKIAIPYTIYPSLNLHLPENKYCKFIGTCTLILLAL